MNILVCVKRVPDTATKIKIAGDGKTIDEAGVQFVVNPYDEFAIEEALRLKEKAGKGEVTALSLGPADAVTTLVTVLQRGRISVYLTYSFATLLVLLLFVR